MSPTETIAPVRLRTSSQTRFVTALKCIERVAGDNQKHVLPICNRLLNLNSQRKVTAAGCLVEHHHPLTPPTLIPSIK